MTQQISVPIILFVFNRPKLARVVFDRIGEAKPKKLYLIADGARDAKQGEKEKVKECQLLSKLVDWPCEVIEIFSEKNLGCKMRISSGLDEVFSKEEMAIIIEDDCLPDLSFFKYCEELLLKYSDHDQIKMVAGGNIAEKSFTINSYFFAQFGGVWGWATWRRAWKKYDVQMFKFKNDQKIERLDDKEERKQRFRMWKDVFEGRIDTWDVQWDYMMYQENALAVVPSKNMIKNLGFGPDATHTQNFDDPNSKLISNETHFPLIHPAQIVIDEQYAQYYAKKVFKKNSWIDFKYIIKRLMKWRS